MIEQGSALDIESRILFDEAESYFKSDGINEAAGELLESQKPINKMIQLPIPMLGFNNQKNISILVISISQEFNQYKITKFPESYNEFYDYFYYSPDKLNGSDNALSSIKNFKNINYFRNIDWILGKIWHNKNVELGENCVYADLIPWPTPYHWNDLNQDIFRDYATNRVTRLLKNISPDVVIALGGQTAEFLGSYNLKNKSKKSVKHTFTDKNITLVSLYKPVSSNEINIDYKNGRGLPDWKNKLIAHIDEIQEILNIKD